MTTPDVGMRRAVRDLEADVADLRRRIANLEGTQDLLYRAGLSDVESGKTTLTGDSSSLTVTGPVTLSGDITPTQITANQNDYNPTSLADSLVLRLSSDAQRNITGIAGGTDGRLLMIHNVGSNTIVLVTESASSSAANRFALIGDLAMAANSSAILQYDSTSSRWRHLAHQRFVGARVSNSAVQSVNHDTTTALTADTEAFDTDAFHSTVSNTSRLTAPWAGYYLINANVAFASNTTAKRVIDFRLNGTTFYATNAFDPDNAVLDPFLGTTALLLLAQSDYVEVMVYQNSGAGLNVTLNEFSMARLIGA